MKWYLNLDLRELLLELHDGTLPMEEWVMSELSSLPEVFEDKHGEKHSAVRAILEDAKEWLETGR